MYCLDIRQSSVMKLYLLFFLSSTVYPDTCLVLSRLFKPGQLVFLGHKNRIGINPVRVQSNIWGWEENASNFSSRFGENRSIRFGDIDTESLVCCLTGYSVNWFCALSSQNFEYMRVYISFFGQWSDFCILERCIYWVTSYYPIWNTNAWMLLYRFPNV